jgi:peptidyl-prolyl cis-trans isomerase D
MLEALRRGVAKAAIVLLFSVLILSFLLWGIPNYTRDATQATIATVGKTEITGQEFAQILEQQRNRLSEEAGQPLNRETARFVYKLRSGNMAADLDRDVLFALIDRSAGDVHAAKLGLSLSLADVADAIRRDPIYQENGQFSRRRFDEHMRALEQRGISQQRYFADRRGALIREMVEDSLREATQTPASLVEILHKYREEQRTILFATLDPAKAGTPPEPTEAQLKEIYERNKRQFTEPERRAISALLLGREELKAIAAVDEAEVRSTWEQDRLKWNLPERRRFQQIAYKSLSDAKTAAAEIAAGKSWLMAALEANGTQGRPDGGLVSRQDMHDGKLSAAVFGLPLEKVSEPIEVRNGAVIVRVVEIAPARERPYDEVKDEIRAEMEDTRQRDANIKLNEQVDELRAQRKPLKDIATELKLKVIQTPPVDRTGKTADGKAAIEHPDAERFLGAAFEPDKNASARDVVELSDGGQAWVEVGEIIPSKEKPLAEVTDQVKALWTEAEKRKALAAAAEAVVERIKKGETLEAIAKAEGMKLETPAPTKRNAQIPGLPPSGLRLAFSLPKGGAGSVESADGKSRMVVVVQDIKAADPPTKEVADRIAQEIRAQYQNDTLTAYHTAVRQSVGYTVNDAAYRRATGAETQ